MSYTIINIETILVRRTSAIMAEVNFDLNTTGNNPDLADPIVWALTVMGYSVSDITNPANADLVNITSDNLTEFLDLCEYRLLLNIAQNFDDVDVRIGHRQEEFSQLANRIIARTDRLRTHIRQVYNYGLGTLEAGVIDLDFDASGDDTIAENSGL